MDIWQRYKKVLELDFFPNTLVIILHLGLFGVLLSLFLYFAFAIERAIYFSILCLIFLFITFIIAFFLSHQDKGQQKGLYILLFFILALILIVYSFIYRGNIVANEKPEEAITDMITCFYFSIVTFTTLGYGDFAPTANVRLLAALEALIRYVFLGLLIGTTIFHLQRN